MCGHRLTRLKAKLGAVELYRDHVLDPFFATLGVPRFGRNDAPQLSPPAGGHAAGLSCSIQVLISLRQRSRHVKGAFDAAGFLAAFASAAFKQEHDNELRRARNSLIPTFARLREQVHRTPHVSVGQKVVWCPGEDSMSRNLLNRFTALRTRPTLFPLDYPLTIAHLNAPFARARSG